MRSSNSMRLHHFHAVFHMQAIIHRLLSQFKRTNYRAAPRFSEEEWEKKKQITGNSTHWLLICQVRILLCTSFNTQCGHAFSNPDQKVHGLLHFCIAFTYETIQNQLKKISDIGLPKKWSSKNIFSLLKLAGWWQFSAMFTIGNFWSPITDVFLNWFWIVLYTTTI